MENRYKEYVEKATKVLELVYGNNNKQLSLAFYRDINTVINSLIVLEQIDILKEIRDKEGASLDLNVIVEEMKKQHKELIEEIKPKKPVTTTKKSTSKK